MPIKTTCSKCRSPVPLLEPLPLPGDAIQCPACGASMIVSYPDGVVDRLRQKGKLFVGDDPQPKEPPQITQAPIEPEAPVPSSLEDEHTERIPEVRAPKPPPPSQEKRSSRAASGWWRTWLMSSKLRSSVFGVLVAAVVGGGLIGSAALLYYSRDLPTIDVLRAYRPPTVTQVLDKDGEILGEILGAILGEILG